MTHSPYNARSRAPRGGNPSMGVQIPLPPLLGIASVVGSLRKQGVFCTGGAWHRLDKCTPQSDSQLCLFFIDIAPLGQEGMHTPQPKHFSLSYFRRPFTIFLALKWHVPTQSPQSSHLSSSWAAIISDEIK